MFVEQLHRLIRRAATCYERDGEKDVDEAEHGSGDGMVIIGETERPAQRMVQTRSGLRHEIERGALRQDAHDVRRCRKRIWCRAAHANFWTSTGLRNRREQRRRIAHHRNFDERGQLARHNGVDGLDLRDSIGA